MTKALLVLLLASCSVASAQSGPVSLVIKVASEPLAGAELRVADRVSVRATGTVTTDFSGGVFVARVSGLYRLGGEGPLQGRVGVAVTAAGFGETLYGVTAGAEYALSPRVGVFGEFALDTDFADWLGVVRTADHTGIGVRLRL